MSFNDFMKLIVRRGKTILTDSTIGSRLLLAGVCMGGLILAISAWFGLIATERNTVFDVSLLAVLAGLGVILSRSASIVIDEKAGMVTYSSRFLFKRRSGHFPTSSVSRVWLEYVSGGRFPGIYMLGLSTESRQHRVCVGNEMSKGHALAIFKRLMPLLPQAKFDLPKWMRKKSDASSRGRIEA